MGFNFYPVFILDNSSDVCPNSNHNQRQQKRNNCSDNTCHYRLPFSDVYLCKELSSYNCSHCSFWFCLTHAVQHQHDLKREIRHLLIETKVSFYICIHILLIITRKHHFLSSSPQSVNNLPV